MSNEEVLDGGITIEILGQEREIKYTFLADIKLKKLLQGKSLLKGWDAQDPEEFVKVLWAGLITKSPELDGKVDPKGVPDKALQITLDRLAGEMDVANYRKYVEKVMAAISIAMPKKEASGEESESTDEEKKIDQ